jgi:LuxR family maltose regulon positive regulatory protein
VRQLLTHLINRSAGTPQGEEQAPLALVLDDYHLLDSSDIQEEIAFLLAHLPASLRVVIITRVDPPLPVARMLARSEAISIRARDLRFDVDEATQFFRAATTSSPVALSPAQIAALVERTEGWPAGLQFAGLQMSVQKGLIGLLINVVLLVVLWSARPAVAF